MRWRERKRKSTPSQGMNERKGEKTLLEKDSERGGGVGKRQGTTTKNSQWKRECLTIPSPVVYTRGTPCNNSNILRVREGRLRREEEKRMEMEGTFKDGNDGHVVS